LADASQGYTVANLQAESVDGPEPTLPNGLSVEATVAPYWFRVTGWEVCPANELFAWLHRREQIELLRWASAPELPAGDVLEIGAGWGASGTLLAHGNAARGRGEGVWSMDICEGFQRDWVQRALRPAGVACVTATSETFTEWPALRLAFVDGDHSAEWAWRDMENVTRHVVSGGVVLLHDCHDDIGRGQPGPSEVGEAARQRGYLEMGGARLIPDPPLVCTLARFRVER